VVVASLIIISAIILALDNPNVTNYSDTWNTTMSALGLLFTFVFTMEMLIKMLVMGARLPADRTHKC
jgi:hypothetical protein